MKSITLLLIGSSLGALAQIDPLCAMPSYGPFKIFAVPLANSSAFYPMTLRDLPGLAVVGYPVTSVLAVSLSLPNQSGVDSFVQDCSECTYKPYDWFLKEMVLIPDFTDREVLSLPVASNSKLSFVTKPSEKPKNNQNYCAVVSISILYLTLFLVDKWC